MKILTIVLLLSAAVSTAFGNVHTLPAEVAAPVAPAKKPLLTGALTVGYTSLYAGRGLVVSRAVANGDGAFLTALQLKHQFGDSKWSYHGTLAYNVTPTGHTLYGNPKFGKPYSYFLGNTPIKQANVENEFAVITELRYTQEKFNVGFGHDFVRGGILGVLSKHYRDNGASVVNEAFVKAELTPTKWFSAGLTTRYSFMNVEGWWFEPNITFKAPLIGTADDLKLAAILSFNSSLTMGYYKSKFNACKNGSQAYWIKLSTPWFARKNFIVTPGVSFNWLGKGAVKANERSEYREYTGDKTYVPFRNFAVVADITCTYTF